MEKLIAADQRECAIYRIEMDRRISRVETLQELVLKTLRTRNIELQP